MKFLALAAAFSVVSLTQARQDLFDVLARESELSYFNSALDKVGFATYLSNEGGFTVFVPTNAAIERSGRREFEIRAKRDDKKLELRNYFVSTPIELDKLPDRINSFAQGSLPLYFSRVELDHHQIKYYVNNALIIRKSQLAVDFNIYIIDTVLEFPRITTVAPDALSLIRNSGEFGSLIGSKNVRGFYSSIAETSGNDIFERAGKNTFFVPLLNSQNRALNRDMLQVHVIPDVALFTPLFQSTPVHTLAWNDRTKYEITFSNETASNSSILLVKSLNKDPRSTLQGSVAARINLANIPVANGVVHFIDSPLGFPTQSVRDFLNNKAEALDRFDRFISLASNSDFFRALDRSQTSTVFIPSNRAFQILPTDVLNQYRQDPDSLNKLMKYHITENKVITEKSVISQGGSVTALTSSGPPLVVRQVHCTSGCANTSLVVECAGVNATVVTSEIAATNGVIYIIDRILGAPSHSIGYKLQHSEPTAITQAVATKGHWNRVLDDRSHSYTFFAPINSAWNRVREDYESDYEILVRRPEEAHRQVARIMSRHLINTELSREDLLRTTQIEATSIDADEEPPRISVEHHNNGIQLLWNGRRCNIIDSDIQATNGVLHTIDCVLMVHDDVNAGFHATPTITLITVALAIVMIRRH